MYQNDQQGAEIEVTITENVSEYLCKIYFFKDVCISYHFVMK